MTVSGLGEFTHPKLGGRGFFDVKIYFNRNRALEVVNNEGAYLFTLQPLIEKKEEISSVPKASPKEPQHTLSWKFKSMEITAEDL